jgi:uncharacterized RDD family membrane protein YckC
VDLASSAHAAATERARATAHRVHGTQARDESGSPYVGLITRAIAFAVDAAVINGVAILVWALVTLAFSLLPPSDARDDAAVIVGGVAFALWTIGYFVAFWTTTGQTPGNHLLQIRVLRADGRRLLPRHAIARLIGMVLAAIPLLAGFLPVLVTDRRRGLHDWLAGTVVRVAARQPAARP